MFVNFVSSFIISIGLLSVSRGYLSQIREVRNWAVATLIQATAWILIGLRDVIPDALSIVVANILILASLSYYFNILSKFMRVKVRSYLIILPLIIASISIYYFTFIIPHFGNRVIVMSVCTMITMFNSSFVLVYKREPNPTHIFTCIIFWACGSIMLFRTAYFLQSSPQIEDYLLTKSILNDILNLSYFITSLMLSFGFILMCNDRYITIQKHAEAELRHTKDILEETYQTARIGSWEINGSDKNIYISKMTKDILELPPEATVDMKSAINYYRGESGEIISGILKNAAKESTSFDLNLEMCTSKGNEGWVRVIGKSEFEDNKCVRIFGVIQDITKEVKLKEEVKFVEERFKNAFEYSAIGIALIGLDKEWIAVNQQMCNITGYEKSEFENFTFKDITHPEDLEKDLNFLQQLKEGIIKSYSMEKRYLHKNGNTIWVFLAVSAIKDKDNKVIQFIAQVKDISKRKKIEKELQQSQQEYKSLFEQNPDGVYSLDKHGKFISANDSLLKMTACTKEELFKLNFLQLTIPKDFEKVKYHFKESQKGTPQNYNAAFVNTKGVQYTLNITNMPIIVDGVMIGCYGIAKDITEQIVSSETLEKSERQLNEAQKIAQLGNYSYDFKKGIWSCSKNVDEMSGLKPEEIKDFNNWKALIAPEFEKPFIEKVWETIKYGKEVPKHNHDYKIIRPHDKEERWVSINAEMEYDNEGNPSLLFGTVQDITQRKNAENRLQQSYDDIRMLTNHLQSIREEERTHIAREIHDELGQQLSVLKMDIMSLKNKSDIASPLFHKKTDQMIYLVDKSIQTVKKISLELRPSILDDLGLIAALEWQAVEFQRRTGIICQFATTCLSDNFSDEINTAVFRIFQESLTNIVRHADANKVIAKLYHENDMLILEVNDNGIGINDNTKNKKTSFGLLGMRERATMLKGDILIQNAPECGTHVKLKIPMSC